MKLREAVSWLMGTLQLNLIPRLEACGERALTEEERQLVSILEMVHIEKFAGWPCQRFGRKTIAIKGREKPVLKPRPAKPAPRKKGRPRRGEVREPQPETRLERQCQQSSAEALAELPGHCDVGTKKNSQGYKETWTGFKLHADVNDGCLPISVALTAASLPDNQVAIPLMKLTSARIDYLFNGRLKEAFGGDNVMVRGAKKVGLHLMFGVIALFADQLLKLMN